MAALDTLLRTGIASFPRPSRPTRTQCPSGHIAFVHEESTHRRSTTPLRRRTPVTFSGFRGNGHCCHLEPRTRGWIQIIPHSRAQTHTHPRDRETKEQKDNDPPGGRRRRQTQYLRPSVCPALRRIRCQSYSATLLLHDPCLLAHHNNVFIK